MKVWKIDLKNRTENEKMRTENSRKKKGGPLEFESFISVTSANYVLFGLSADASVAASLRSAVSVAGVDTIGRNRNRFLPPNGDLRPCTNGTSVVVVVVVVVGASVVVVVVVVLDTGAI